MSFAKGTGAKSASYAKGGAALGRTRDFMKTPDNFRDSNGKNDGSFAKGEKDSLAKRTGDKCLTPVKPRA